MKKKKCAVGGDLQSPNGLDMLSMGLSLVPGWGQIASPALGLVSGLVKKQQAERELRNTVITGTPGNFVQGGSIGRGLMAIVDRGQNPPGTSKYRVTALAKGGYVDEDSNPNDADDRLSNNSFQVKGNPSKQDGNDYNYKGSPVALDHNEVVDTQKDFVYSNIITNPLTNKTFAKDAEKLQRATGKAEKAVAMHNTKEAKNTLKYHKQQATTLAGLQELIKLGESGMKQQRQGFADGGKLPWDGFGVKEFQQFANEQGYVDPATGKPIGVDNSWGPQSQGAFAKLGDAWAGQLGMSNVNGIYSRTAPLNIVNNPQGMSVPNPTNSSQFASWDPNRPNWQGAPAVQNIPQYMTTPSGEQVDVSELGGTGVTAPMSTNQRANNTTPFVAQDGESFPMTEVPNGTSTQAGNLRKGIGKGMIGDSLQGMEVLSKFFETMQPAEVQKPYLDNTRITKQSYDPRPALAQNDRNYQNSMSSLSTPSINLRRALSNNMYASKLDADQQAITQYDTMNKQARTQYEGAVSNRVRYNNQQELAADDMNSRNRAAKDQAIQNAFTSLGNFGEALNRKDQSYSSLALLKELYPDVYDRIIGQYNTKTTVKIGGK